ncbi:MAG TPA: Spy/CpxP family protein refolding chaperone, partial [Longimicrobiales bacterium]
MRRIALSTLAVALTLGTASIAAAQQPGQAPQTQQQERGQHQGRWQREGRHGRRALFKGVKLTNQQKQQLKAINQKYAAQFKSLREAMRPVAQQARADRQKGD